MDIKIINKVISFQKSKNFEKQLTTYLRRLPMLQAYSVRTEELIEGYFFHDNQFYGKTRGEAKSAILSRLLEEGWELNRLDKEITFLNVPMYRNKEEDKYLVGQNNLGEPIYKTKYNIIELVNKHQRQLEYQRILNNPEVTHAYIVKNGSYYCSNHCGYTNFKFNAGVYTKEEAIYETKLSDEISIEIIDVEEHNKMILDKIDDLKTKLINVQ